MLGQGYRGQNRDSGANFGGVSDRGQPLAPVLAGPLGNDHNLGPDGPASLDISHLSKIRSDCRTVRGFSPRVVSDGPRTFLTPVK